MHFANMTVRSQVLKILQQEDINFLLTNRIPRRLLTRLVGWLARIEQPLVRDISIWAWQLFSDLDLSEAKKTSLTSVRDCFTRELKDGARPVDADPALLTSPCDAIVGAGGAIEGTKLYQIKGFPYRLEELLHDPALEAMAPATVLVTPPGAEQIPAVGDGTLTEPGRYVVICTIPTGVSPQAFLDAVKAAGGGKPVIPDAGAPHLAHGMFAQVVVT